MLSKERFALIDGKRYGVSEEVGGVELSKLGKDQLDLEHNGAVQRQLADLQVNDWLSGQVDRHGGNFKIDAKGKVYGFDNDQAFGTNNRYYGLRPDGKPKPHGDHGFTEADKFVGLPDQISTKTANRIKEIDLGEYRAMLENKDAKGRVIKGDFDTLQPEEIDAAVERMSALKSKIAGWEANPDTVSQHIIPKDGWGAETYARSLQGRTKDGNSFRSNSYVARWAGDNDAAAFARGGEGLTQAPSTTATAPAAKAPPAPVAPAPKASPQAAAAQVVKPTPAPTEAPPNATGQVQPGLLDRALKTQLASEPNPVQGQPLLGAFRRSLSDLGATRGLTTNGANAFVARLGSSTPDALQDPSASLRIQEGLGRHYRAAIVKDASKIAQDFAKGL